VPLPPQPKSASVPLPPTLSPLARVLVHNYVYAELEVATSKEPPLGNRDVPSWFHFYLLPRALQTRLCQTLPPLLHASVCFEAAAATKGVYSEALPVLARQIAEILPMRPVMSVADTRPTVDDPDKQTYPRASTWRRALTGVVVDFRRFVLEQTRHAAAGLPQPMMLCYRNRSPGMHAPSELRCFAGAAAGLVARDDDGNQINDAINNYSLNDNHFSNDPASIKAAIAGTARDAELARLTRIMKRMHGLHTRVYRLQTLYLDLLRSCPVDIFESLPNRDADITAIARGAINVCLPTSMMYFCAPSSREPTTEDVRAMIQAASARHAPPRFLPLPSDFSDVSRMSVVSVFNVMGCSLEKANQLRDVIADAEARVKGSNDGQEAKQRALTDLGNLRSGVGKWLGEQKTAWEMRLYIARSHTRLDFAHHVSCTMMDRSSTAIAIRPLVLGQERVHWAHGVPNAVSGLCSKLEYVIFEVLFSHDHPLLLDENKDCLKDDHPNMRYLNAFNAWSVLAAVADIAVPATVTSQWTSSPEAARAALPQWLTTQRRLASLVPPAHLSLADHDWRHVVSVLRPNIIRWLSLQRVSHRLNVHTTDSALRLFDILLCSATTDVLRSPFAVVDTCLDLAAKVHDRNVLYPLGRAAADLPFCLNLEGQVFDRLGHSLLHATSADYAERMITTVPLTRSMLPPFAFKTSLAARILFQLFDAEVAARIRERVAETRQDWLARKSPQNVFSDVEWLKRMFASEIHRNVSHLPEVPSQLNDNTMGPDAWLTKLIQ